MGETNVARRMRVKSADWSLRLKVKMLASRRCSISLMRGCVHVPVGVGGDGAAGRADRGVEGARAVCVDICLKW